MNYLLCIESSANHGSSAIFKENELIAYWETAEERSHSRLLASETDRLIRRNINYTDLKAVAVSAGPGSYTGLRIGVSVAKGICFAMGIPLISIGTLDIIAEKSTVHPGNWISPMIHARKNEVYCSLINPEGEKIWKEAPLLLESDSFQDYDDQSIIFCGNGASIAGELYPRENFKFLPDIIPTAEAMGKLAWEKYLKKEFEDLGKFEPEYLKPVYTTTPKK